MPPANAVKGRTLKGMLRSATPYALVAGLLLGAELCREQVPFLTGAKREYHLTMTFLNHDKKVDAGRFDQELESKMASGEKPRILFMESATLPESDYVSYTLNMNLELSKLRSAYNDLVAQGMDKSQAREACLSSLNTETTLSSAFYNDVLVTAAIHGLVVMPIEGHTKAECDAVVAAEARIDAGIKKFEELRASDATLNQLADVQSEIHETVIEIQKTRDDEIIRGLDSRFALATKLFPMLRLERLRGNELYAVGFMGQSHMPVYSRFNRSDPKLRFDQETYNDGGSIQDVLNTQDGERSLTRKEALLSAIDFIYFMPGSKELIKIGRQDIVNQGVSNALSMPLSELEQMADATAKMPSYNQRLNYVMNRIMGQPIFHVGETNTAN
jgi:hypothetical protein